MGQNTFKTKTLYSLFPTTFTPLLKAYLTQTSLVTVLHLNTDLYEILVGFLHLVYLLKHRKLSLQLCITSILKSNKNAVA